MTYVAHVNETTKEIQTVKQHSENTASLCRAFSIPELRDVVYAMGLLHDIGKYQDSFQLRIQGKNVKVEHSACGAIAAKENYSNALALMMEYCIAGHHSGIPDAGFDNDTQDMPTLYGRMKRIFEDYSAYQQELQLPVIDETSFLNFLVQDCGNSMDKLIDKFAFFTRYCFSCLTDADSLDTANFCGGVVERSLKANFQNCLDKINQKLLNFICITELQKARACLQKQVFDKSNTDSEVYLMNMPTGSGKTLCSLKFALERAVKKGKKRIIYIIPYNSIIDQTAQVFEDILGADAEILRHQSTFSYDERPDYNEDYTLTAKYATENWDAQLIITTAVQFFESLYANKRGKLRKLHNMADSILIFDEAHLMPQEYLQPCLEGISYITKYLNSEAVFLTATMPDFKKLIQDYSLVNSKIIYLIDDTSLFCKFQKCQYHYLDYVDEEALLSKAQNSPTSLIIVNKRATARKLFSACPGRKYHLSTYMTAFDRKRVISEIKQELSRLEDEYPGLKNVPPDKRITVISTSLIEAGVDLDFYTVFRELAGLDSILQAGGRCNREGKRVNADVLIFRFECEKGVISADERGSITKSLFAKYEDISFPESIEEYYDRLFFLRREDIVKHSMYQECQNIQNIPFRKYTEKFELIDTQTVSIVVARDEKSKELIAMLQKTGIARARELQNYAFSVHQNEFDDLYRQHTVDDYGSGVWCLKNNDYYDEQIGVVFEAKDYFI